MSKLAWGLAGLGLLALARRSKTGRHSGLELAPPAKNTKLVCPIIKLNDPNARETQFWDSSMLDPQDCPIRGLDIPKLPAHIKPFAEFMLRQGKKPVRRRDIAKAYLLTASSIQREAQSAGAIKQNWPSAPFKSGKVRPEDVMGALLSSTPGQRYLDAAAKGKYDSRNARVLADRFASFGLSGQLLKSLKAAPKLATNKNFSRRLRKDSAKNWAKFVNSSAVPGIGPAKAGFFGALLGRGDLPTADARQLSFWLCRVGEWDTKKLECRTHIKKILDKSEGDAEFSFSNADTSRFRDQLEKRLAAMNIKMPVKYRKNYQHLAHHAVWDHIGKTKTTHKRIIDAMESA